MNRVTLIGRLAADPQSKDIGQDGKVCNFRVLTSEHWVTNGEKKEKTEGHNCVAFAKLASVVDQYCCKGKLVAVEGKLQTRKWTDKEGRDHYSTEIVASQVLFLDSKKSGDGDEDRGSRSKSSGSKGPANNNTNDGSGDDDLPF